MGSGDSDVYHTHYFVSFDAICHSLQNYYNGDKSVHLTFIRSTRKVIRGVEGKEVYAVQTVLVQFVIVRFGFCSCGLYGKFCSCSPD